MRREEQLIRTVGTIESALKSKKGKKNGVTDMCFLYNMYILFDLVHFIYFK